MKYKKDKEKRSHLTFTCSDVGVAHLEFWSFNQGIEAFIIYDKMKKLKPYFSPKLGHNAQWSKEDMHACKPSAKVES